MGAWIEIEKTLCKQNIKVSLLSWERGLKSAYHVRDRFLIPVAPLVGAWIEIFALMKKWFVTLSLLSWERGLKL